MTFNCLKVQFKLNIVRSLFAWNFFFDYQSKSCRKLRLFFAAKNNVRLRQHLRGSTEHLIMFVQPGVRFPISEKSIVIVIVSILNKLQWIWRVRSWKHQGMQYSKDLFLILSKIQSVLKTLRISTCNLKRTEFAMNVQ